MASAHESIKWKVIQDWTTQGKGRLYCCNQALAIPWEDFKKGIEHPKWFGPLKRKFKGFPDTFGFERMELTKDYAGLYGNDKRDDAGDFEFPIFCTVEVKTIDDDLSADQIKTITALKAMGVRCYIAKETEAGAPEYELKEFEG